MSDGISEGRVSSLLLTSNGCSEGFVGVFSSTRLLKHVAYNNKTLPLSPFSFLLEFRFSVVILHKWSLISRVAEYVHPPYLKKIGGGHFSDKIGGGCT